MVRHHLDEDIRDYIRAFVALNDGQVGLKEVRERTMVALGVTGEQVNRNLSQMLFGGEKCISGTTSALTLDLSQPTVIGAVHTNA